MSSSYHTYMGSYDSYKNKIKTVLYLNGYKEEVYKDSVMVKCVDSKDWRCKIQFIGLSGWPISNIKLELLKGNQRLKAYTSNSKGEVYIGKADIDGEFKLRVMSKTYISQIRDFNNNESIEVTWFLRKDKAFDPHFRERFINVKVKSFKNDIIFFNNVKFKNVDCSLYRPKN